MKRILLLATLAFAFFAPGAVSAQKPAMEVGKWTGTVTPPDEGTVDVTYDVAMKGDTIAITLDVGEHGSFVLENIKLADGKLTFQFTPGPVVTCALEAREEGGYAGECSDPDGEIATMVMLPPKKEG